MQMTQESMDAFLKAQQDNGASKDSLRQRKGYVGCLYQWLPEDKLLSRERLLVWREDMQQKGYSQQTILNYVKGINLYLDYMGWSGIRFNRGRAKDIRGLTFGYLTPMEPTAERDRKDIVWRCKCRCGKVVKLPATRLMTGNTLSCGCMKAEKMDSVGKNIAGTSLVMSLREDVRKPDTLSGYTGVSPKRDKWYAHITYRGKRYHLGTYSNIEDAVKARARAKELVMEDAQQLLELFETLHSANQKPDRASLPKVKNEPLIRDAEKKGIPAAVRSDNASGYPGVSRSRNQWKAYISYDRKRYVLGYFLDKSEAIEVRKKAEKQLKEDPASFVSGHVPE